MIAGATIIIRPVNPARDSRFLYELLAERTPVESISHRLMPGWRVHDDFVRSSPYEAWYIVELSLPAEQPQVGAVYLTKQREIGIHIAEPYRRRGYAREAIRLLMARHPGDRFRANIAPLNDKSHRLFEGLGFRKIQHTYELSMADAPRP